MSNGMCPGGTCPGGGGGGGSVLSSKLQGSKEKYFSHPCTQGHIQDFNEGGLSNC